MSVSGHPEGYVDPEEVPIPDVSGLITEDDTPVDNVYSEKQMRLLTEPLYASWTPPDGRPFFLAANVGVFARPSNDALVPDVFLSLDTAPKTPLHLKQNRSYFVWEHGKPPDVVVEVVSNREGDELTRKLRGYERMRVVHYVVYDPERQLSDLELCRFELQGGVLVAAEGPLRLPSLDLGLTRWPGTFEQQDSRWLRWCRLDGTIIPTGAERASTAEERASTAEERASTAEARAARLEAKLRELGLDPETT
ncbi:MAG: Uma2 family endonuclease [Myxococcota bacterium]